MHHARPLAHGLLFGVIAIVQSAKALLSSRPRHMGLAEDQSIEGAMFQPPPPEPPPPLPVTDADHKREDGNEEEEEVPRAFLCPIGMHIMCDPVFLIETGHTFEREIIEAHLNRSSRCPLAGVSVKDKTLMPNYALRNAIQDYLAEKGASSSSLKMSKMSPTTSPPEEPTEMQTPPSPVKANSGVSALEGESVTPPLPPLPHAELTKEKALPPPPPLAEPTEVQTPPSPAKANSSQSALEGESVTPLLPPRHAEPTKEKTQPFSPPALPATEVSSGESTQKRKIVKTLANGQGSTSEASLDGYFAKGYQGDLAPGPFAVHPGGGLQATPHHNHIFQPRAQGLHQPHAVPQSHAQMQFRPKADVSQPRLQHFEQHQQVGSVTRQQLPGMHHMGQPQMNPMAQHLHHQHHFQQHHEQQTAMHGPMQPQNHQAWQANSSGLQNVMLGPVQPQTSQVGKTNFSGLSSLARMGAAKAGSLMQKAASAHTAAGPQIQQPYQMGGGHLGGQGGPIYPTPSPVQQVRDLASSVAVKGLGLVQKGLLGAAGKLEGSRGVGNPYGDAQRW